MQLAEEDPTAAGLMGALDIEVEDHDDEPWFGLFWDAWDALRYDRQYGAFGGETPVTYAALSRYVADQGIPDDDLPTFRRLFGAMDREWLKQVAERARISRAKA